MFETRRDNLPVVVRSYDVPYNFKINNFIFMPVTDKHGGVVPTVKYVSKLKPQPTLHQ